MSFNKYLLMSAAAVFGGAFLYAIAKEERRKRSKKLRFEGRDCLSLEDVYERFYSSSGLDKEKVLRYWSETGKLLRLEVGKLRPEDRFDKELAPVRGQELADEIEDLSEYLASTARELRISADLSEIKTLDDLIKRFARRE